MAFLDSIWEMTQGHGYLNIKVRDSSGCFPHSFCMLLISKHCSHSMIKRKPQLLALFLSIIRFSECAKSTCNFCRKTPVWVSKGNQIFWGNPLCTTLCPDNESIVKWMAPSVWKEYSYSSSWLDALDHDVYLKLMWYFERCSKLSKDFYFLNNYHPCILQMLHKPTLRYLI